MGHATVVGRGWAVTSQENHIEPYSGALFREHWSRTQAGVALSSVEAELVALVKRSTELIGAKTLCHGMGELLEAEFMNRVHEARSASSASTYWPKSKTNFRDTWEIYSESAQAQQGTSIVAELTRSSNH